MDTFSRSIETARAGEADHSGHVGVEEDLSDFEFALMRTFEGFARWQSECLGLVSSLSASGPEITLLNVIRMNDRPKTIKELARVTNRDDVPNIQYSLRKLASSGLIRKTGSGRGGVTYSATDEGLQVTAAFDAERRKLLLQALEQVPGVEKRVGEATRVLNILTGIYDGIARSATAQRQT
ncbi:winged helix DNA-binding protein [Phaeobacter porticola]|uniref:Putative transcription regulator n=1 Tax=Phaeobacter porticola TaxID=1844006 RepID=A0A1L3I6Z1_9RHOB|nr:winged helix DNA-binding protein [Phaeobacter porticola]APG47807.1 putative transcription regulator [Phaeobacter porticola]